MINVLGYISLFCTCFSFLTIIGSDKPGERQDRKDLWLSMGIFMIATAICFK